MRSSQPRLGGQMRLFAAMLLLPALPPCTGCRKSPKDEFAADTLKIYDRYARVIDFAVLDMRVPLEPNCFVRIDPPVSDTQVYLQVVFQELGVTPRKVFFSNPAEYGIQVHLRFRDGKQCSFIWAKQDADPKLVKASVEHEKYHAVCRLKPEAIGALSAGISKLGFRIELADYDEEFAATVIQMLTLYREGIPLEELRGSELVVKAVGLLRTSRIASAGSDDTDANRPGRSESNSTPPAGKKAIEIPFTLLDEIPVVECQLNERPAALYLDTASQPTCLYQDRLAGFGLALVSEEDVARFTAAGHVETTPCCGEVTLKSQDGLRMKSSRALCLPGRVTGPSHEVDGILGVKIMTALKAVIDSEAHKITFTVKAASGKESL